MQKAMAESMSSPFELVLDRKAYEIFAAHWPHSDDPGAEPLNRATKHVASTTRRELEWENSELIEGEVPDGVRALKQADGPELQVLGRANLIQTLLEHGLIDEFRLWIFRLVLGAVGRQRHALYAAARRFGSTAIGEEDVDPTIRGAGAMPDHEERPPTTLAHGAVKSGDIERVRRDVDQSDARVARDKKTSAARRERELRRKAERQPDAER
jgi:dihydrofolate reductase